MHIKIWNNVYCVRDVMIIYLVLLYFKSTLQFCLRGTFSFAVIVSVVKFWKNRKSSQLLCDKRLLCALFAFFSYARWARLVDKIRVCSFQTKTKQQQKLWSASTRNARWKQSNYKVEFMSTERGNCHVLHVFPLSNIEYGGVFREILCTRLFCSFGRANYHHWTCKLFREKKNPSK